MKERVNSRVPLHSRLVTGLHEALFTLIEECMTQQLSQAWNNADLGLSISCLEIFSCGSSHLGELSTQNVNKKILVCLGQKVKCSHPV